jgi:hypothetical protein
MIVKRRVSKVRTVKRFGSRERARAREFDGAAPTSEKKNDDRTKKPKMLNYISIHLHDHENKNASGGVARARTLKMRFCVKYRLPGKKASRTHLLLLLLR